ncbi:MAG TPA: hypothetical protein VMZ74_11660 [Ramlibacter sp.]|nr:hypothetical protein [Ramlibacter sp.]
MNTVANTLNAAPQPLLSTPARVVAALAVAGFVAAAWFSAEQASHQAVLTTTAALSRNVIHVRLPTVEIVARREPAAMSAVAASGSFGPRTQRSL